MFYSEFHKESIPYGIPFKKCDFVRIPHEFRVKNDVQMEVPYGIPFNSIRIPHEFHMECGIPHGIPLGFKIFFA